MIENSIVIVSNHIAASWFANVDIMQKTLAKYTHPQGYNLVVERDLKGGVYARALDSKGVIQGYIKHIPPVVAKPTMSNSKELVPV